MKQQHLLMLERYFLPRSLRNYEDRQCFTKILDYEQINDQEFKFQIRCSRAAFWEIYGYISEHPIFSGKQIPIAWQLLVLLKFLGSMGNASSSRNISSFFGIGYGTVEICKNRVMEALLSLEKTTVFWPDAEQRKIAAKIFEESYIFPNCVGIIDGTLLNLAAKPTKFGENYLSRKRAYSVVMLVICDEKRRILYYHVGWPGSVHDNRVWRNCKLCIQQDKYFSSNDYLIGDSAFTTSNIMVPAYKKLPGAPMSNNQTIFNTYLAKPRVESEHCIGLLKGRFPFLKHINVQISGKKSMFKLIKIV